MAAVPVIPAARKLQEAPQLEQGLGLRASFEDQAAVMVLAQDPVIGDRAQEVPEAQGEPGQEVLRAPALAASLGRS